MVTVLALMARGMLATIFIFAGVAKLIEPKPARLFMSNLWPRLTSWIIPVVIALSIFEIGVGLAVLLAPFLGASAASLLLGSFIPPYPSPFIPVDFSFVWWLSVNDTQRFRFEKRYATRTEPRSSGLVELNIGTGAGGVTQSLSYWEGRAESQEQVNSPRPIELSEWVTAFTAMGRGLLERYQKGSLAPYAYLGIETDPTWGQVHAFENISKLEASDLYPGLPIVERYTFDVEQLRQVEWKRTVKTKGGDVIHRLYRLQRWLLLDEEEVPEHTFELISVAEGLPVK